MQYDSEIAMKYYIDNDGIHLMLEKPIPDMEALESVKHVAQDIEAMYARYNADPTDALASRETAESAPAVVTRLEG